MNIVEPYARLMAPPGHLPETPFIKEHGEELLRRVEWCARISHRSENQQGENTTERFIRSVVLDHGDWSVVEHASVSVDCLVDRGITHELVRHRLFSYTQESTRFVNYEKKMEPSFIQPPMAGEAIHHWHHAVTNCEQRYRDMLAHGCAPQIARSVFPNALASRIIITGNLRNFRHLFIMRTTKEAHPQMRQVMVPLLEEFQQKIPILFEDIKPMARQVENLRLPR